MTRDEFKVWLKDEVTLSGALSAINLPDREYDRIIDRELKMLYELNPEAQTASYCIIPCGLFYTPEFRANRTLKFPDCVLSVTRLHEMKRRNAMFGISDPDFGFNKAFQADMWLGSMMNMDSVMFRTIQWSVWDQLKQFTLINMQHRWNAASHELLVMGHDPHVDVFCGLAVKTAESELFDNVWVQKWIAAHCKIQANKLMTFAQTTLIGGVTINMAEYTKEAADDIEACKKMWSDMSHVPRMHTL